jgi:hypothetical protein
VVYGVNPPPPGLGPGIPIAFPPDGLAVAPRLARRAKARQSLRHRSRDTLFSSVASDDGPFRQVARWVRPLERSASAMTATRPPRERNGAHHWTPKPIIGLSRGATYSISAKTDVSSLGSLGALGKGCAISINHRIRRGDISSRRARLAQHPDPRHARLERRGRRQRRGSSRLRGATGQNEGAEAEPHRCQETISAHYFPPIRVPQSKKGRRAADGAPAARP